MNVKKTVTIKGQLVELELRACASRHCKAQFWASPDSKQSICSRACWQLYARISTYKTLMPKPEPVFRKNRRLEKKSEASDLMGFRPIKSLFSNQTLSNSL